MTNPGASGAWQVADPEHCGRPLDPLSVAALAYLALPMLLFCGGWLKPVYGVLACLLLLAAIAAVMKPGAIQWRLPLPAWTLLGVAAAGFAWAAFGGAGHFFYANSDWPTRDAVLADLVHTPWPPSYGEQAGAPVILRTALAYFLPAAALGALVGAKHADLILYLWTGLGAALFFALLPLPRARGRLAAAIALLVMFSGMDAVGAVLLAGHLPSPPIHLEWWDYPLQYSSQSTQLFWVPNHALPAWIAAALVYRHWNTAEFWPVSVLLLVLLPLWTPFAAIGIAPFVACLAADRLRRGLGLRLPLLLLVPAALLLVLQFRFLLLGFDVLEASTPPQVVFDAGRSAPKYLRFVVLEFGVLAVALLLLQQRSRGLLAIAVAVLAALPLISFGPSNDIVMRASIPALAVLAILCVRALDVPGPHAKLGLPGLLLGVVLLLGAVTPLYEFWRALARPRWAPALERSLPEAMNGLHAHYVGRLDRPDLRAVMRAPSLVVTPHRARP